MSVYRHWEDLRKELGTGIQRRINSGSSVKVYACLDHQGSVGICFEGQWSPQKVPNLEFIALQLSTVAASSTRLDVFLKDEALLPLFQVLCDDLITFSTYTSASINTIIERLTHWQDLLANAESDPISIKKVRGLIGELVVLNRLGRVIGVAAAISAWSGPLGTPQDFYYSSSCIEVKSVGPGAKRLQIHGVEQLEPTNACDLHLCVLILGEVANGGPKAVCLNSLVEALREELSSGSEAYGNLLGRLQSAGWQADSEFNSLWFEIMASRTYHVLSEFPRLRQSELSAGISFIRYDIEFAAIKVYEVDCLPGEADCGT